MISNVQANTYARRHVTNWLCRFDVPFYINSDQGRYFQSRVTDEYLVVVGILQPRGTIYATGNREDIIHDLLLTIQKVMGL